MARVDNHRNDRNDRNDRNHRNHRNPPNGPNDRQYIVGARPGSTVMMVPITQDTERTFDGLTILPGTINAGTEANMASISDILKSSVLYSTDNMMSVYAPPFVPLPVDDAPLHVDVVTPTADVTTSPVDVAPPPTMEIVPPPIGVFTTNGTRVNLRYLLNLRELLKYIRQQLSRDQNSILYCEMVVMWLKRYLQNTVNPNITSIFALLKLESSVFALCKAVHTLPPGTYAWLADEYANDLKTYLPQAF